MKIATREDLINILTRYEGAVQETAYGANDDADVAELEAAREELMKILQQAKVQIQ